MITIQDSSMHTLYIDHWCWGSAMTNALPTPEHSDTDTTWFHCFNVSSVRILLQFEEFILLLWILKLSWKHQQIKLSGSLANRWRPATGDLLVKGPTTKSGQHKLQGLATFLLFCLHLLLHKPGLHKMNTSSLYTSSNNFRVKGK